MFGKRQSLIVFLGIVIFTSLVSNGSSNTIAVTYTKEEFIEVLEILNGGSDSSVPDFLFFTQSSLQTYANTVGPPRNRTEKRRPSRPHPPNRLPADVTLSRASERLRKGQNVEVINKWARVLDILLFNQNNKLVPTNKECAAFKMLGFDTSVVCSSKSKKKNHNGKREQKLHKESPRDRKRLLDILTLQVRDDDDDDDNDDDDEEEDQIQEEDKIQDGVVKDDMRNDEGSFRGKFKRKIVEDEGYHPRHHQRHSHDLKGRSPIQTIDIDRMRRSLPFTYSEIGECYEEGTQGTTDDTILLCETCYKTVDFGSDVIPQYANSVECNDNMPNCVSGDGTCTQKVIYYSFKKMIDGSTTSWESYQQPLNVSCECECIANTITATYLVGNSN